MGIGRRLIDEMTNTVILKKEVIVKAIVLDVMDYKKAAINFYKKMNFELYEIKEGYYELFSKDYSSLALVKYLDKSIKPRDYKYYFPFSLCKKSKK